MSQNPATTVGWAQVHHATELMNSAKNRLSHNSFARIGGCESENLPCVHATGLMETEIGKCRKLVVPACIQLVGLVEANLNATCEECPFRDKTPICIFLLLPEKLAEPAFVDAR